MEFNIPEGVNDNDKYEINEFALKQLSRCRFEIYDNKCFTKVSVNEDIITVYIKNDVTIQDFKDRLNLIILPEPSINFMLDSIDDKNQELFSFLNEYKEKYYKLGTSFDEKYWFKLYDKTEIEDGIRDLYNAGWIDYEKQLENGNVIYDEKKLAGLWAIDKSMLFRVLNDVCKERYGSKIFVLKLSPNCRYLYDNKEIIGDRFEFVRKYDLDKFEDVINFLKFLYEDEKMNNESKMTCYENEAYNYNSKIYSITYKLDKSKKVNYLLILALVIEYLIIHI